MAWGWPFLLRLAGAHRRRPRRPQPAARSLLPAPSPSASLPVTGPPLLLLFCHVASLMDALLLRSCSLVMRLPSWMFLLPLCGLVHVPAWMCVMDAVSDICAWLNEPTAESCCMPLVNSSSQQI